MVELKRCPSFGLRLHLLHFHAVCCPCRPLQRRICSGSWRTFGYVGTGRRGHLFMEPKTDGEVVELHFLPAPDEES